ncbi:MAG TPA: MerR family transcriptional regulator [Gemmatimonadales bacterium]|nr:MerR family transcriptional regulator [Gemmatimonadales bacterium]
MTTVTEAGRSARNRAISGNQPPEPDRPSTGLTVQQAAIRTGLSEHTLRYYERAGLLEPVDRQTSSRHRRYSDADVSRLTTLACLRATGMPLNQMRRYFVLAAQGQAAAPELQQLLEQQERVLHERLQEMQRHLHYVRHKIQYWSVLKSGDSERARQIATELAAGSCGSDCHLTDANPVKARRRDSAR